jgi:hypothetical protein
MSDCCSHFDPDDPTGCSIGFGRRAPRDCHGCSAYDPRLEDGERTQCEVWTRVMGYHRPVSAFNDGKKSEHAERKLFVNGGDDWQGVNNPHESLSV